MIRWICSFFFIYLLPSCVKIFAISPCCAATQDVEIQCELDEAMTIRTLPLEMQGFLESYMAVTHPSTSAESGSKG